MSAELAAQESSKNDIHDLFVRALAVPKPEKKRKDWNKPLETWPKYALAWDSESRITVDQSLTFGVYRLLRLIDGIYAVIEEGIFYADDLPKKERKELESHIRSATSDVTSFPPRFPLYSRSEFMQKVFWPAIKNRGAMVVGFNLPYDISRCAVTWSKGEDDEWSLTMSQYPDGNENRNYPRILIKPIDSKKAFIRLATPWKTSEWKNNGQARFIDLRTLLWALYNRSFSLKRACDNDDGPFKGQNLPQKLDYTPTGKITPKEIEYARQDVRCTAGLLNALKQEFDKHPIDLRPWSAYSPASVAKSYLAALGIVPPAKKFDVPHEIQGIAMQSYFGGRSETKIRCAEVPVCPLDFTSSYPSCCALLGLFDVLTAESVNFKDDTEDVHRLLKRISHNGCFNRDLWEQFTFWALVLPDDDILPVRTVYDGVTQNIGNNYLTSEVPIWIAGPDLIASAIRTRKAPRVIRAIRMVPSGKQAGMQSVKLRGLVEIDPYRDDLFRKIIEDRKKNKSNDALYYWLKILANSIYGFFVELNPETQSEPVPVTVFSGEKRFPDVTDTLEKPGAWFFAPLASLITSGGRLLLALAEECVTEARGTWMAADTDSIMVVSSKKGRQLRIPGSEGLRILSWDETQAIAERFAALNPYDPSIVKQNSILNLTDENFVDPKAEVRVQRQLYGYSIAAKRYALYERLGRNDIKIVDAKGHGIGYLYPPKDSPDGWGKDHDVPQWIWEMWEYIVRGALGLKRRIPAWAHLPQMMRVSVTTYNVLKMLHEWKGFRPYNFLFMPMIDPVFGHHFYVQPNEKVLLVTPFSAKQDEWFDLQPMNVHTGGKYRMADLSDPSDIDCMPGLVFPQTFGLLVRRYQEHPESKSLAPDGSPCKAKTRGVLRRAHIVAGDLRCVGKETDRKWEDGDDLSVTEFAVVEYGRAKKVTDTSLGAEIRKIGIRKTMKLTKMSQHTIEKLVRGEAVKRGTHERVLKAIHAYRSKT